MKQQQSTSWKAAVWSRWVSKREGIQCTLPVNGLIVRFGVHPAPNHRTGVFVMGNVSRWMGSKTIHVCMLIYICYCKYTAEGVVFLLSGLAKQTRQGKPRAELFFLPIRQ